MDRNKIIDLWKLIFVICIFIGHLNNVALVGEKNPIIMRLGFLGVEFFFIVSGFLMFKKIEFANNSSSLNRLTFEFLKRKIEIFFPCYCSVYILGFVVYHIGSEFDFNALIRHFIMSIPCIMQLNMVGMDGYQVLAPTWFLSAMLISMLFLFPLYKKNF